MSKKFSKLFGLFAVAVSVTAGCSALIDAKGNGIGAPCEITKPGVDPCRTDKGYFCTEVSDGFRCVFKDDTVEDGGTPDTSAPDTSVPDTGPGDSGKETGPVDSGPPPGTSGGPCEGAGTCLDPKDFCATAGDVDFLAAGSLCTSMCRKTTDCAAGEMCAASKAAAGVCVPKTLIGRGTGTAAVGATCATNNDCATGYCPDLKCRESCAATTDCGAGETCFQNVETFKKANGDTYQRRQGLCLPKGSRKDPTTTCTTDAECSSGICGTFKNAQGQTVNACAPSCGSIADCSGGACFTGPFLKAASLENVRICAGTSGTGATGSTCSTDDVCKEENCLQSTGTCGALCSRPSDCAGSRCRPQTNKSSIAVAVCAP